MGEWANVVCRKGKVWWWRGGWNLVKKRERERERETSGSSLICAGKQVCDVWKSDGEAKGVETKQARLVKRKSGKCGLKVKYETFLGSSLESQRKELNALL